MEFIKNKKLIEKTDSHNLSIKIDLIFFKKSLLGTAN